MWAVLKFEKKEINSLKRDLEKKLGSSPEFYIPKIKIQNYKKNKIFNTSVFLLGDYLLCYHEKFTNAEIINSLKYCKGLKHFLLNFKNFQGEIINFIKKCKKNEDEQGFIKQSFFNFENKNKFKFLSGPFVNMIFKIINQNHKKMKILLKDIEVTVPEKKYLFRPV
jgi:hypothetical protein